MSHARGEPERGHSLVHLGGFGQLMFAVTRVGLGLIFLWSFLDLTFGLGRATPKENAWVNGGSPGGGYLSTLQGTFADEFKKIAGKPWADWLFMLGLAGLGVALILGIAMGIAAVGGTILLVTLWLTSLPLPAHPFIDHHLIYASVIIAIAASGAGLRYSLAPLWRRFMPKVLW